MVVKRHPCTSYVFACKHPIFYDLKEQASAVIDKFHIIGVYVDVARKVVTVLSIVMLIVDAVRYFLTICF